MSFQTYTIRTTINPGAEIVVGEEEYLDLLRQGLVYGAAAPGPVDPDDLEVAGFLDDETSQTYARLLTQLAAAVDTGTGALPVALRAAFVPKWKPSTAYTAGEPVINPSGQIVTANTSFTSGASYSAGNWTVVSGGGGTVADGSITPAKLSFDPATQVELDAVRVAVGRQLPTVGTTSITSGSAQAPQNGPLYNRTVHTNLTQSSEIRLRYGQPLHNDTDGTLQPVTLRAFVEFPLARRVTDGTTTNGSPTVTSATAAFTAADKGRQIIATGIPVGATISTVDSATSVTMSANSTATGSGVTMDLGFTLYPATFRGRTLGTLDNAGIELASDTIPAEIPPGSLYAVRCFQTSIFGTYTTLTAAASAGATTIQLNTLPGAATNPNGVIGDIVVDTGGNAEKVTVLSYSGSAGAWIAALSPATPLTKAHASGAIVGGQVAYNGLAYADQGEVSAIGATDYTSSGIPPAMGAASSTLTAASSIGDRFVSMAAAPVGTAITIDTAGNQETATVVNVVGEANPYKVYVSAPLTIAHASGATVTSGRSGGAFRPIAIAAEKTVGQVFPTVIIRGDSIADGVGYNIRAGQSFATLMLDGRRPFIKTTKAGESAQQFAQANISRRRKSYDYVAGWLFYQYVTNGIFGGRTLAQEQADAATIIGWAKQRGMKVMMATCLPRTTSTDGWATTANQTVLAAESVRLAYNTWVRGGAGGLADAVFDGCQVLDSGLVAGGAETGLWRPADPNNGPYTASGLHPDMLGHLVLSTYGIANAIPQLV